MKKLTIYTSKTCGYCTTLKQKFKEKEIEFTEKSIDEYKSEWNQVVELTGLPTTPTIEFNANYYVPGRDFQNPEQLTDYIKSLDSLTTDVEYSNDKRLLEAFKTLTFTLRTSLNRLQQDLTQIKQKLDEHKSTS